jgi:hypothetical protein
MEEQLRRLRQTALNKLEQAARSQRLSVDLESAVEALLPSRDATTKQEVLL